MCSLDDNDKIGLVAFDRFIPPSTLVPYPNIIFHLRSRQTFSDIFIIFHNQHKATTAEANQKVKFLKTTESLRLAEMKRDKNDKDGWPTRQQKLMRLFTFSCAFKVSSHAAPVNLSSSLLILTWKRLRFVEMVCWSERKAQMNSLKEINFQGHCLYFNGSSFV